MYELVNEYDTDMKPVLHWWERHRVYFYKFKVTDGDCNYLISLCQKKIIHKKNICIDKSFDYIYVILQNPNKYNILRDNKYHFVLKHNYNQCSSIDTMWNYAKYVPNYAKHMYETYLLFDDNIKSDIKHDYDYSCDYDCDYDYNRELNINSPPGEFDDESVHTPYESDENYSDDGDDLS